MLTSCPRCQATFPCPPEPSPSVPLSFVLGGGGAGGAATPGRPAATAVGGADSSEQELLRLRVTMLRLQASGWYHEGLTWWQADALLAGCSPGTFLLRDSADPRFLLSLSAQTHNGPTSVRLHYTDGYFRMDAEPSLVERMPLFECVVRLVEHYIALTGRSEVRRDPVWLDSATGQMHAYIDLRKPLYRTDKFPTLQHLARLAVNKLPQHSLPTSALPRTLRQYLAEYPYVH
ncbi:hypothetical protein AAG570_011980 [Ranatra chinensis]|uniref:Suppressor of cytokine signaling 2 n=1 Tax=Ranatra chinensis TaxID=642074 RepID=A0ABD0Z5S7_9HEMI